MTTQLNIWHSIIVGGGASGLFCAGSYAAPKLLLEHNARTAIKLGVTGGGKCNFTNLYVSARDYLSANKHFCHNALAAFRPRDFIRLVEEEHIPFCEKEQGQMFARNARDIADILLKRAKQAHTDIRCGVEVLAVERENELFRLRTSVGVFYAKNLIIASGGLSYPALGASAFAWRAARSFGLSVLEPKPVLAGFRLSGAERLLCRALAGCSTPVAVRTEQRTENGALLFTHEGISGPAVLQTSLYWNEGEKVQVNFLPDTNAAEFLHANKNSPALFSKILSALLNVKIAKTLLGDLDVRAADAPKAVLTAAAKKLNEWTFVPSATSGYTRAEATAGGADTKQFDPSSMQCKNIPGLFFIGEALDVTGRVGGYNLHWAWASAACAARALGKK